MSNWRTILIIPDTHVPDQNRRATAELLAFIDDYQPSEIIHLGDFLDLKAPARWSKGLVEEFAGNVQQEADAGQTLLGAIRSVFDGPIGMHQGNHDSRIATYVQKYAPALSGINGLTIPHLLGFDFFEVDALPAFHQFAPGWITTHGDKGVGLAQYAGGTAIKLARKIGRNVVCGHTHRQGIINETHGLHGKLYTLTGVECGHISDISKAEYLGTGSSNWQMGWALMHVKGSQVVPELVPLDNRGNVIRQPLPSRVDAE